MSTDQLDAYAVLGVNPGASSAEISAAYRCALLACHPDTTHPDRDRLAAVIAAHRQLRDQPDEQPHDQLGDHEARPRSPRGTNIPVRVHHRSPAPPGPDLRAGPVRRHLLNTDHRKT